MMINSEQKSIICYNYFLYKAMSEYFGYELICTNLPAPQIQIVSSVRCFNFSRLL